MRRISFGWIAPAALAAMVVAGYVTGSSAGEEKPEPVASTVVDRAACDAVESYRKKPTLEKAASVLVLTKQADNDKLRQWGYLLHTAAVAGTGADVGASLRILTQVCDEF